MANEKNAFIKKILDWLVFECITQVCGFLLAAGVIYIIERKEENAKQVT